MTPPHQIDRKELIARGDWSFVWSRDSGSRVLVIVDDDFHHVAGPKPFPARLPESQGLFAVFRHASDLDDTRAVGFFRLPSVEEMFFTELLPNVQDWLDDVTNGETRVYFLIDVFYGKDADIEMGPQIQTQLISRFPNAKFAFLSQTGIPSIEKVSGPLVNPNVFVKTLIEGEVKRFNRLPRNFLEWIDAYSLPDRASDWDLQKWRRVRQTARYTCKTLGDPLAPGDPNCYKWAHHLNHGGLKWTDSTQRARISPWTERLRSDLARVAPEVDTFPAWGWDHETKDTVYSWERPPVRALSQFTNPGKDLTTVFYLVSKDVRGISRNDLKIRFATSFTVKEHPFKHDYLWFNVSALATGLFLLSASFYHEVLKIQEGNTNPTLPDYFGKRVQCTGGRAFWEVAELNDSPPLGLRVRVSQYLLGWSVNSDKFVGDENLSCLQGHKFRFPSPADSQKTVKKAYESLERCGAKVVVDDGVLTIEVLAREVDGVWEVSD
jgi:hypothetical protein